MHLLSVIVPVYNVSDYLGQCLESIIHQTYTNLEIILVNDGSTDNSGEICDTYAKRDKRIKVIHKENGGLSSARNAGMAVMTGTYVAFVDSDDWLELDAYEHYMQAFAADSSLDVVRSSYKNIFCSKESATQQDGTYHIEDAPILYDKPTVIEQNQLLPALIKGNLDVMVWLAVYRVQCLRELKLTFLEGLYHEDEYFSCVLYGCLPNIRMLYLPKVTYNYRRERLGAITQRKTITNLQHLVTGFLAVYEVFAQRASREALAYYNYYVTKMMHYLTLEYYARDYSKKLLIKTVLPLLCLSRSFPMALYGRTWRFRLFVACPYLSAYFVQPILDLVFIVKTFIRGRHKQRY